MRSEGQIRQQLKQVLFRHLQRELRLNFKRVPESCCHNRIHYLGEEIVIGACSLDPDQLKICDLRFDGYQKCLKWQPHRSKDQIREDFRKLLNSGDRGLIATRYPDVVALMWVLDEVTLAEEIQTVEDQFEHLEISDQDVLWEKGTES